MDRQKDDTYYAKRILSDLEYITLHMQNIADSEFAVNEILQDAMMFRLIQISENAKKITDEYQRSHPDIPWSDINGLRNRIVHDYGNVDLNIVFETLKFDIPDLIRLISGEIDEPDIER